MPELNLDPDAVPEGASAVQRAYSPVASAIVSGTLRAGTLITEGEVSAALGMSRTPVREAFLLLQARGLLTLHPKKGALVTALDDDQVHELLQARVMIEAASARLADADTPDLEAELERLLEEQRRAAASDDLLSFAHADHLFHARVVEGARNHVIDEMYQLLGPRFERVTHRTIARDPSRLQTFLTEHEHLAALVTTGRADEYDEALRRHVMPLH